MRIAPIHPDFVGEVSDIDISAPLSRADVAGIEAGMDRYAVLVFRDQPLTDEQQCIYSRNFGDLEATLIGQMSKPGERRLGPVEMGDISNLTVDGRLRERNDNRRMYALMLLLLLIATGINTALHIWDQRWARRYGSAKT